MDFISEPLLALLGFLYLKIRYRNKEVIAKILDEKYHGRYQGVGIIIVLNMIAGIGVLAVTFAIIYVVIIAVQKQIN
jgi:hypothetical protein